MKKTVTLRKFKSILPILIGIFVVTGFICLPTPQRFIDGLSDERSQWIDQSRVDKVTSSIKSPVYSLPVLMSDPRPLNNKQSIVAKVHATDSLIHIVRLYRHVLVARAP